MQWLPPRARELPADAIFATSWETAYAVRNLRSRARKLYFVQDYEASFYPAGSIAALAEDTYRFGFLGITLGPWLAHELNAKYGMRTKYVELGLESSVYRLTRFAPRDQITFYARPATPRRGFELGIMALDLFHKSHPSVAITLVGMDATYDLPFPHRNVGVLAPPDLNSLYNESGVGLVLSFTNPSLLPLEMIDAGALPVVNDSEASRMLFHNDFVIYADSTPRGLADALGFAWNRSREPRVWELASESVRDRDWSASATTFVQLLERELGRGGASDE